MNLAVPGNYNVKKLCDMMVKNLSQTEPIQSLDYSHLISDFSQIAVSLNLSLLFFNLKYSENKIVNRLKVRP